jgi:hypothetical protein
MVLSFIIDKKKRIKTKVSIPFLKRGCQEIMPKNDQIQEAS